jgi:hypothetical protein
LSASVARTSPLLLLILLRCVNSHVVEELSDSEEGTDSCSRACNALALECLSFLMLNIPDACKIVSESLLDPSSITFTHSIECHQDHVVAIPSAADLVQPIAAALFKLERQSLIQAFGDALGDPQKGTLILRALECIKEAAAAVADGQSQITVQLVSSLIEVMLRSNRSNSAASASKTHAICALLCIDVLLDERVHLAPSISFCLVDPVAAWLRVLACSLETDWLAISTACTLWNAAAASLVVQSNTSMFEYQTNDSSFGSPLEVAALALRRIVSMQPPEGIATDVVSACDSCSVAFRAISSAANTTGPFVSHNFDNVESISDLAAHSEESLPSHVRCGALLRLQNLLLHDWNRLEPELKDAVLRAVQTCLFDAAAGVYVAAVEVLCVIGRVDPSSAFLFGSKFLSSNSADSSPADVCSSAADKDNSRSKKDLKETLASSRDLALCKVLDALGDVVCSLCLSLE